MSISLYVLVTNLLPLPMAIRDLKSVLMHLTCYLDGIVSPFDVNNNQGSVSFILLNMF